MSTARSDWTYDAEDQEEEIRVAPRADLIFHHLLRALQFILAIPVLGIYAGGIAVQDKPSEFDPTKWVTTPSCDSFLIYADSFDRNSQSPSLYSRLFLRPFA